MIVILFNVHVVIVPFWWSSFWWIGVGVVGSLGVHWRPSSCGVTYMPRVGRSRDSWGGGGSWQLPGRDHLVEKLQELLEVCSMMTSHEGSPFEAIIVCQQKTFLSQAVAHLRANCLWRHTPIQMANGVIRSWVLIEMNSDYILFTNEVINDL